MTSDPLDLSTTDGQLLARFAQSGEQAPFEAIVRRHGSLVLGVCRAVLAGAGAQHDAEDAAQATFLTLARKSRSLGGYDSIAGWLYRVAWHIAKRTRAARELRTRREREAAAEHAVHHARAAGSGSDLHDDTVELTEALHDELNKLSEKYRLPLILHHLEGWTEPEIAELLGCRVGTLSGRLSRGRQMLRDRIARHRHHLASISTAGIGTALLEQARASALSPAMQHHLLAPATAGGVSAQAATLAQGAIDMLWRKVLVAAATYATCAAVLLIGTGLVMHALIKPQPQLARLGGPMPVTNPADPTGELLPSRARPLAGSGHELAMSHEFTGEVSGTLLGPDGQPVSGAAVKIFASRDAFERGAKPLVSASSDERGEFVFPDVPAGSDLLLVCTAAQPQPLSGQVTIPTVSDNQPADLGLIRLGARQK
jgi:RNA polymerase sigma factor (sigma-70 family)